MQILFHTIKDIINQSTLLADLLMGDLWVHYDDICISRGDAWLWS